MTFSSHSELARSLQAKSSQKPCFSRAKWLQQVRADRSLPRSALHLAAALSDHFDKLGSCFPSATRLARLIGLCERWTRRLLQHLAKAGFLTIEPNNGHVSTYRATFPQSHVDIAAPSIEREPAAVSAKAPAATPSHLQHHIEITAPPPREAVDVDTPEGRRIEDAWRRDTGKALPWPDARGLVRFPSEWLAAARLRLA
jgi:hypothetical protein